MFVNPKDFMFSENMQQGWNFYVGELWWREKKGKKIRWKHG